ncbi:MAG TPA: 5-methyltetrahydropteroyltriglutamate--homocysteine S-methyltransferase [Acidimicrobiales bacterium]|nr:5-methyltetrahydropteroyltriglutamate--homocysteine S-methyltransferase [Acidimicrobiales bacterium]
MPSLSNISGFPRIGPKRELKAATERFWRGEASQEELEQVGRDIRRANWTFMKDSGVDLIPSNDFSFYDQVLDTIALTGAVPARYQHPGGPVGFDTYFAMARGLQDEGVDVTAVEMTKWFDTNYHYLVPELGPETEFALSSEKVFDEHAEARALGIETVPVLVGPLSFLVLGKSADGVAEDFDRLSLLDRLLPVYEEVLARLGAAGAEWVQLDEPVLVQDRSAEDLEALRRAYERLGAATGRPKIVVKTYFDHVGEAYPFLRELPVEGVGLDFHRGEHNHQLVHNLGGLEGKTLFAGVVDGRNVWINDLAGSLGLLEHLAEHADDVVVSTSCSLQHSPIDLDAETGLDPEIRSWMAFARQKVGEVATLARGLSEGRPAVTSELEANAAALGSRRTSPRTQNPAVRDRVGALTDADSRRASKFPERRQAQQDKLGLPLLPTTTIGSYPQTAEIRQARTHLRQGRLGPEEYAAQMKAEIERVVRFQEDLGYDVLVHGEPERNDMVQYFAEQMEGYVFTQNAWVQSYGSRYVRPPVIYGDVLRPRPMTVEWALYAQSLTEKPVKGMLTGPVTMLMWSFVRDDQPRSETCKQLALAIGDEVADLEAAGIAIIQVDEPAIREGLPLRRDRWEEYLDWAVFCFRVSTSGVDDTTQIQTHLCYSDFGDIMAAIHAMDADVLLVEASRSRMELLSDFRREGYLQEVGPGVYDIHSPRVPSTEEMAERLRLAIDVLEPHQIWVNPDCGLKTRGWPEVESSLRNMVLAAQQVRAELS